MDNTETLATSRSDRNMQLPFQQVRDHMVSYNQTTEHGRFNTALQLSWHMNDREEIEDVADEIDLGLVQHHIFYNARIAHATTEKWRNTLGVQGSVLDERNKEEAKEILVPDARFNETGLYYMSDLELGKTFIQAGLRYDFRNIRGDAGVPHLIDYGFTLPGNPSDRRLSRNFSGFTGSLGASHKIGEGHTLKANFSTGFRAPDLAELFSNGPHPGTNRFEIGDADFGREQSLQADLFFAATGELRDDGLEIWAFDQTDGVLYGGEFSAAYMPFGDDRLTLSAAAHIIRGEDLNSDENLTFVPPDQLMFRIGGRPFADDATSLFLGGRYAALQNRPGPGEAITPAYFLLDAGAERSFPMGSTVFTAGISVFNALNAVYVDHMSILRSFNVTHPGRNIAVNLRLNF
ncbi:MAG: TonB-dependent receptor [Flavobacteriales bacterium]|nr:TonB-dependent receptor [Flavobacteriales bacterium]